MARAIALLSLWALAGGCDRGEEEPSRSTEARAATDEPAATLRALEAPKPPVGEAPAADDRGVDEEEVAERDTRDRRRSRRRRGGGGATMSGGGSGGGGGGPGGGRDRPDGIQDTAPPGGGPCPGGDPCPNGGYLVETCVTGGMAFRDENGDLTARRSCHSGCAPAPPRPGGSTSCQPAGCRRYSCQGYAP